MEFKTTLEIVTKDIQDIEKLVSNFKKYSKIPNIELDLALSRLRNVYDLLLLFRDEAQAAPVFPEKKAVKEPAPSPGKLPVTAEPLTVIHSEQVAVEAKPETEERVSPVPVPPERKPVRKRHEEEEKKFINEKLGEQYAKKDIAMKLQGQPIKSIAGNLGINDKFFFIRELFAGNSEAFSQTVSELDECSNFNEAHSLLMAKFQWDMDSEAVQMLLNLIRRRFITSRND